MRHFPQKILYFLIYPAALMVFKMVVLVLQFEIWLLLLPPPLMSIRIPGPPTIQRLPHPYFNNKHPPTIQRLPHPYFNNKHSPTSYYWNKRN
ncbi:unnamed protein product [Meloidogyne enterolobii]|uniref:Uncharacterized protein n=1 Tax=Meloidogyne enterolobii TaxID=390850 RepID=A0ACB0XKF2_MELEN